MRCQASLLFATSLVSWLPLAADVTPASLFGDHMVLQREMPVPVWGTASPGEKVTVSFTGKEATATAGAEGRWKTELPPLEASAEGRELRIQGTNPVVFKDVLVGEVWICSGQSNMQYGWGKESLPMFNWGGDADLAALAEKAKKLPIRSYHVPTNVSYVPEDSCKGEWSTDLPGSAVAFGFAYHLQQSLDVPVAMIVTCWGSSSIEGWMPRDLAEQLPHFKEQLDQLDNSEQIRKRIDAAVGMGIRHGMVFVRKQVNLLYNAMLHPVIPYACRGMVWYQGEANANRPDEYAKSLPAWMKRVRKAWGRDDFHFLVVMLPGYGEDDGRPDAKSWAWFREAQMSALELPHAGVVNTIDLGDVKNIHPPDKAPIAERLALLARRDVYGEEISGTGPRFKGYTVEGKRMMIEFDQDLTTTDGNLPTGFWLADKEGAWKPATATVEDRVVIVKAKGIETPVACRYAFSGKPEVNLTNRDGLPAYPFRTDEWTE